MQRANTPSEFMQYLAALEDKENVPARLPSLSDLSQELGVSVARLREQMEVARALGLVEVRPKTGIRRLPYTFLPAVRQSLSYAVNIDSAYFEAFSELRNHIEAAYWHESVRRLTPQDHEELKTLMASAWEKLNGSQVQIPHAEHRRLHMGIYRRLSNAFALGILEAYWEAYEAVGLNQYAGYDYLQEVWHYHQQMVDAILRGDYEAGYRAMVDHKDLLQHRPAAAQSTSIENSSQIETR